MKKYISLMLSIAVLATFSAFSMQGPLGKAMMEKLEQNIYREQQEERNKRIAEDQCIICLEDLNKSSKKLLVVLPCNHIYHRICLAEQVMGDHLQDDILSEVKNEKKLNTTCGLCKQKFSPFSVLPKDYFEKQKKYQDIIAYKKFEVANKDAQLRLIINNSKYLKELLAPPQASIALSSFLIDVCAIAIACLPREAEWLQDTLWFAWACSFVYMVCPHQISYYRQQLRRVAITDALTLNLPLSVAITDALTLNLPSIRRLLMVTRLMSCVEGHQKALTISTNN